MSSAYENRDESEAVQTIHRAIELGITLFGAAEVYNDNEKLVGRAIRNYRDRVVIATKFGFKIDESGTIVGLDSSPENVRQVCDASLRRLEVDYMTISICFINTASIKLFRLKRRLRRWQNSYNKEKFAILDFRKQVQRRFVVPTLFIQSVRFSLSIRSRNEESKPRFCRRCGN
jgi:hypothetical protein